MMSKPKEFRMNNLISSTENTDRLVDQVELIKIVRISKSQIKRLEDLGRFPKRMKVGLRRVAWSHTEIQEWIDEQKQHRHVHHIQ
jgi:prophage regulatory protein